MSCKSAIYSALQTSSTVTIADATGANLPMGAAIRRFGCNLQLSGNSVLADGQGYYEVDTNVVLTPAVAGKYTVCLLKDGMPVPGAFQTIQVLANAPMSFNVPAVVRNQCCASSSLLTLNVTTDAALPSTVTVNNVTMAVEKI